VGLLWEGMRLVQLPLSLTSLVRALVNYSCSFYFGYQYIDLIALQVLGFAMYLYLRIKYGSLSLDHITPSGPYQVGYTEFSTERGNYVSVFYPVDASNARARAWSQPHGFRSGFNRTHNVQKNLQWVKGRSTPACFIRSALCSAFSVAVDA
jgi:hypothetical protein